MQPIWRRCDQRFEESDGRRTIGLLMQLDEGKLRVCRCQRTAACLLWFRRPLRFDRRSSVAWRQLTGSDGQSIPLKVWRPVACKRRLFHHDIARDAKVLDKPLCADPSHRLSIVKGCLALPLSDCAMFPLGARYRCCRVPRGGSGGRNGDIVWAGQRTEVSHDLRAPIISIGSESIPTDCRMLR